MLFTHKVTNLRTHGRGIQTNIVNSSRHAFNPDSTNDDDDDDDDDDDGDKCQLCMHVACVHSILQSSARYRRPQTLNCTEKSQTATDLKRDKKLPTADEKQTYCISRSIYLSHFFFLPLKQHASTMYVSYCIHHHASSVQAIRSSMSQH